MTDAYDDIKEWLEDIYDREGTLDEIADGMWELVKQGRDEYLDLEGQIIDALT
jgi:aldehyde:ferredoxin oxidoreductase